MLGFNGLWYPNGADQIPIASGDEQNNNFWNNWK